ncbi:MAG: hypothetical protein IID34_07195 [Planctomycetes bacterium]|nr:hypothetical protein [Planctomycetota bacterium]
MNKNSKILLIAGGVVVAGAIGFFAWSSGDQSGSNVASPVVSSQAGLDVGESDLSTPARGQPSMASGGSSARLSADSDRSDIAAASEDTLVASKKKGTRKKSKRNRRKGTDSEAEDAGPGNAKKVPPAGSFDDDL